MRKALLVLLFIAISQLLFAQSAIKGTVSDSLEKKMLGNAVVAIIKQSDSTLFAHTRTAHDGSFKLPKVQPGTYLLLITYPKFIDFIDVIEVDASDLELGSFPLIPRSALLEDVIVSQNIAIRMKGDTIEYKADSFKVAEGASVKELLRKLPGMQVDKNGRVIAHGQAVEKVLVDGEEFFSDDPAVVIENLRADAIDKVQSYDKKSDQAEFTGVDDGTRSKTLNLVLKDDKKKGLLGKLVVGGGSNERYSEEAMLNYFKGKKKFSIYGIASNTGRTGLGWEDRNSFGGGTDYGDAEVEMGAGFIMINSDGDADFNDWQSDYYDEGIPRTIRAGAHASNKWKEDKQSANGNYSLKDMKVNAIGSSLRKFILPDSSYYSRENHNNKTIQRDQLFNGTFDIKLDSASSLRFKMNGRIDSKELSSFNNTQSEDEDLELVNRNRRTNETSSTNKVFMGSVLWRQKLKKKGRTFSLSSSFKNGDRNSDGFLFSETDFFETNGNVFSRDTIDQYKTNTSRASTWNSKLVYTEPLGKKGMLEFNYTLNHMASTSDRKSFDKANGKYEELNPVFSNNYGLRNLVNSAGMKYQYTSKKVTANIGTNIGGARYRQLDSLDRPVRQLNYTNLFPTGRFTYRFSPQRSFNFNYSGSPQAPGIDQVQPIRENNNPLFIIVGNPELEQAFRHNFSMFFTDFKLLTGRNIWIHGSFNPVQNAIVSSQVIDKGITTQQYVNASGNYNYRFSGSYGFKIPKTEINTGINTNASGGRNVNWINGVRNVNRFSSYGGGFSLSYFKEEKFDININTEFNYNRSLSNVNPDINDFWGQEHNILLNWFISKKFIIATEANFYLREKTDAFTGDNNFAVWDAFLTYRIFKKRNASFRLVVKDILKQRRGFNRSFNNNVLFERQYNMLGRYAMLSFTWNFTKNPGEVK
ncbi:MAG: outer membrane beta-barrel family protein [Chitinophagaceae bacterium]